MSNNLQQSIDFIKSQLSKGFIFINVYPDVLRTLIDGLEEQQRVIDRLRGAIEFVEEEMVDDYSPRAHRINIAIQNGLSTSKGESK